MTVKAQQALGEDFLEQVDLIENVSGNEVRNIILEWNAGMLHIQLIPPFHPYNDNIPQAVIRITQLRGDEVLEQGVVVTDHELRQIFKIGQAAGGSGMRPRVNVAGYGGGHSTSIYLVSPNVDEDTGNGDQRA